MSEENEESNRRNEVSTFAKVVVPRNHHFRQGRDFGFDGKTLIHPKQIPAANDIFGISSGDVDHARQVIEAFESATQAGHGVVTLHGKLVERMHVTEAQRVLDMAGILHNSVV